MFKNRAAWLAVAVLAIASAIMIFVIMPQINGTGGDAGKQPQEAAKKAAGEDVVTAAGKVGRENASGSVLLEKVDRLKADAAAAAKSLQALYAGGNTPTDAELADARAKLEAALKAIAELTAPSGADTAVTSVVSGLSASAAKALEALKSMPADAGKAAETVSLIAGLFGNGTADTASAPAPKPATAPEPAQSSAPVAAQAVAGDDKIPAFDVLRVEKDGSTVIAGRAAPGSSVEIVDGDKTIASSKAGPEGDFAIVLDTPLSAGDHTLVLRSTDTAGKVVQSQEEATVSVPSSSTGELLAMVSRPGEASRILTMPDAEGKLQSAQAQAPSRQAAADNTANGLPPLPSASSVLTTSAPSLGAAPVAEEPAAPTPSEAAEIRIEAVEIENDNMYVAGISRPETGIQVYVDDKLLQATKSSADGHFVAEGVMPLATGNHIVRADVMDTAGSKVLLRASVPFNRPPGDQVSVVADTTAKGSTAAPGLVGGGPLDQLREEAAKAIVLLKGLFEDGKTPAKDQLAAAKSACKIAFKALADFKSAPDASPGVVAAAGVAAKSAADALKILDAAGDDPAKVGAAIAAIEAAAKGAMPEVVKPSDQKTPAVPGGNSVEMSSTAPKGTQAPAVASSEPKSVEQAPLKESSNSVIIRKGDTLWQISRRLYGRGIRYTTIYLANQDQISDPNMITPGQVFGVPDKTLQSDEDAEKANRNFQDR